MNNPTLEERILAHFGRAWRRGDFNIPCESNGAKSVAKISQFLLTTIQEVREDERNRFGEQIIREMMISNMEERVISDKAAKKHTGFDFSVWVYKGDVDKLIRALINPPQK